MKQSTSSGTYQFKPRARLIKTIGEELISNDIVALIELVKNSYDANASIVSIDILGDVSTKTELNKNRKKTPFLMINKSSAKIIVYDDGDGMDLHTLETAWMQPATDFKKKNTNRKRRFTGEKGIGRFASAKLATHLTMTTKMENSPEIEAKFDWNDFQDNTKLLEDVCIKWESRPPKEILNHGTKLTLENVQSDWDENKIRALRIALSRLLNPLSPIEDFIIELNLPDELNALAGIVDKPITLEKPDYKIRGSISEEGKPTLFYSSKRRKIEDDPITDNIKNFELKYSSTRGYQTGPFDFEFRVWDRDIDALNLLSGQINRSKSEIKKDLNELAGISIYRDGIRVLPYGNKDYDWLGLNRKRVDNPTLRLSNNQIIGYISIGLDSNPSLSDQSNREGLVENQAYFELIEYISLILNELEIRRYNERPREKETTKSIYEKFSMNELSSYVKNTYPNDKNILELFSKKEKEVRKGINSLHEVLVRYRRLSTLGVMVDMILHDGGNFLSKIDFCSSIIKRTLNKVPIKIDEIRINNDKIIYYKKEFNILFKRIEPFGGRKKGRPKSFIFEEKIRDMVELHRSQLNQNKIEVKLPKTENIVKIDESELGIILMNLLLNSIYWLSYKKGEKLIQIDIEKKDLELSMIFSDNGPGISEDEQNSIFLPYYSSKKDGVGLGLTIIGEIVSEYDGELSLIKDGPLPGACFKITFKYRI